MLIGSTVICAVFCGSNLNPAEVPESVLNQLRVGHGIPDEGPQGLDVEQRLDVGMLILEDLALRVHLLLYLDQNCKRRTRPSKFQMRSGFVCVLTKSSIQDLATRICKVRITDSAVSKQVAPSRHQ